MASVFTIATNTERLAPLVKTAKHHHVPIHTILLSRWNGWTDKVTALRSAIQSLPNEAIVCYVDGYDVLVNGTIQELVAKFKATGCDAILGGELNCYPGYLLPKYPEGSHRTNHRYVNAGVFLGTKECLWDYLTWKSDAEMTRICNEGSDQAYLTLYFLEQTKYRVQLDEEQTFFQNMHQVSWDEIVVENGRLRNTVLGTTPCFVHFNGGVWECEGGASILPILTRAIQEGASFPLNTYTQKKVASWAPRPQTEN